MLTLALIGLVGGLITGVSPCVLPMLPIIFFAGTGDTRETSATSGSGGTLVAQETSRRTTTRPLKIIAGLIVSFSVLTLAGSAILSALGLPDDFLRWAGLVVLTIVGLGMIVPAIGHVLEKPFYRLPTINNSDSGAFFFGLGLGTLYVPCAGPVLAAITVAGATGQVGIRTVVLTVSFAIGAALPLLIVAAAGARAGERIRAFSRRARTFRVASGVVLIALAVALAFDAPAALQRTLPNYTGGLEQKVADSETVQGALTPLANDENQELSKCRPGVSVLESCGQAPSIKGISRWLNTPGGQAVSLDQLRGKVVLIDFFAYSCINCQRDAPYLKKWDATYRDSGLRVIGIHSPEFAFEKSTRNLTSALKKEGITYPVAQDNDLGTWTNYRNRYWPAKYLIDADGTVRSIKFGEGDYTTTEKKIRTLLKQADPGVDLPPATGKLGGATPGDAGTTPETYVSYQGSNYRGTPRQVVLGRSATYRLDADQPDDSFSLGGRWNVTTEYSEAAEQGSTSRLSFSARKVFHVLAGEGTVTVDIPGEKRRTIDVSGTPNLYEIYSGSKDRHIATLTYSEGVRAYTFSFG